MALPQRALTFFLALAPLLLARGQTQRGPVTPWVRQEAGKCKIPSDWDPKLRFTPRKSDYALDEVVQLSCVGRFAPSVPQIECISRGAHILCNETPTCKEKCQKPQWDSRFIFDQEQEIFDPNEVVKIRCPEGYWPPPMEIKCVTLKPREGSMIPRSGWGMRSGTDAWHPVEGNLTCVDVRQVVPKIPEISSTSIKLKWTCRFPHMCQNIRARCQTEWHSSSDCETEEVKVEEMLQGWEGTFICSPLQPFTVYSVTISRLPSTILYADLHTTKEMVPDKPEKLWVDTSTGSLRWKPLSSCKGEITGYQLNITTMRAEDGSFIDFSQVLVNQSVSEYVLPHQKAGNKYLVIVQGLTAAGAGPASQLEFQTYVLEKCQKPQWDSRFIFDQEQEIFNPNEVVKIRCPEGYWPPPMEIKCVTLKPREGSMITRSGWSMRSGTDAWRPVEGNLTCVDVRQVVPKIPEISSTSIKLKWTCRFPHMCQNIRARCQTEWHSSSDCETEEVKVEEMLQGWEGTFICSPLQPFTVYSVTISRLPSTILYADLHTTKEMVPDKPEKLWVDTSTGSLRWKPLSSCKGEITGYQLNITTMRAEDGSFIDFSQVLVNQSVSEYVPPHQTAGNKYLVTVQGLTAAGAGPASQLEFQTYVLEKRRPCPAKSRRISTQSSSPMRMYRGIITA
ncbi:uncharacterized protein LOC135459687 isoform X2 [Zonotrichia leucophrys gambelii]|uniref:uncharacterized protein LOC135459687 isoform X2 n=1 Tax=Zonotrichia leucophrys gambelii TaxID=257770 RepID=UPI00313FFC47